GWIVAHCLEQRFGLSDILVLGDAISRALFELCCAATVPGVRWERRSDGIIATAERFLDLMWIRSPTQGFDNSQILPRFFFRVREEMLDVRRWLPVEAVFPLQVFFELQHVVDLQATHGRGHGDLAALDGRGSRALVGDDDDL